MTNPANPNNAALLPWGPDDIEEALAAWFAPLRRSSVAWETGDGTPFTLITLLSGDENVEVGYADPIVQIDTLTNKEIPNAYPNAKREKTATHQRMLELGFNLRTINLSGRTYGIDYMKVLEIQHRLPFGMPTILRYVGRYQFGIEYVPLGCT